MKERLPPLCAVLAAVSLAGATACSDAADVVTNEPDGDQTVALVSVSPPGGTVGIDPNSNIVLDFDHPMAEGMEQYCSVHSGGLDGMEVVGHWEWSDDHHRLTFMPDQPFERGMDHALHVGGGMLDEHGHGMDFDEYGSAMGGHWVDEDMLGPGGGMMGGHGHMGEGWTHENGMLGMAFEFTTEP